IDRCNQPPYGGPPTPPKQVISIFGGACSQVWFPVVDVTLKNEKKLSTLKDISTMILGKMKQTAKTYLSERVTHAFVPSPTRSARPAPQPPPLTEPSPQAMHQDQLSDLKYAELQANAKKHGIRANGGKEHLVQRLATYFEEQAAPSTSRTTRSASQSSKRCLVDQEFSTDPKSPAPTSPSHREWSGEASHIQNSSDPIVSRTNPNPRKENQRSTGKLPEAPLTQALLSLAAQPGHDNALRPTSTDSPSQPAEPAFPNVLRLPPSSNSRSHSPIPLKAINPAGAKALSNRLRTLKPIVSPLDRSPLFITNSQEYLLSPYPSSVLSAQPFQLSFQQPFQTGRVPDNQTIYGDIILEYFISNTTTIPQILIAPPPDFDPTARSRSKRLVKLLLNHGPIQKFAMRIKDDGGLHLGG
ncbi:hypothetical protein FRC01_006518, partial [Tulasnella sp. 417]